jgi:hypothetical protein
MRPRFILPWPPAAVKLAKSRTPQRTGKAYLLSLLAEARSVINELCAGLCLLAAARAAHRIRQTREAAPPADVEAERVVLGAALRRAMWVPSNLFALPEHRALAQAIETGDLSFEQQYPPMRGYRRGLQRTPCRLDELKAALDTLEVVRAQREALAAAERAVTALRDLETGAARGAIELQAALDALTECEVDYTSNAKPNNRQRKNAYTFRSA